MLKLAFLIVVSLSSLSGAQLAPIRIAAHTAAPVNCPEEAGTVPAGNGASVQASNQAVAARTLPSTGNVVESLQALSARAVIGSSSTGAAATAVNGTIAPIASAIRPVAQPTLAETVSAGASWSSPAMATVRWPNSGVAPASTGVGSTASPSIAGIASRSVSIDVGRPAGMATPLPTVQPMHPSLLPNQTAEQMIEMAAKQSPVAAAAAVNSAAAAALQGLTQHGGLRTDESANVSTIMVGKAGGSSGQIIGNGARVQDMSAANPSVVLAAAIAAGNTGNAASTVLTLTIDLSNREQVTALRRSLHRISRAGNCFETDLIVATNATLQLKEVTATAAMALMSSNLSSTSTSATTWVKVAASPCTLQATPTRVVSADLTTPAGLETVRVIGTTVENRIRGASLTAGSRKEDNSDYTIRQGEQRVILGPSMTMEIVQERASPASSTTSPKQQQQQQQRATDKNGMYQVPGAADPVSRDMLDIPGIGRLFLSSDAAPIIK